MYRGFIIKEPYVNFFLHISIKIMLSRPREKIARLGGKFLFYLKTYVLPFEYLLYVDSSSISIKKVVKADVLAHSWRRTGF